MEKESGAAGDKSAEPPKGMGPQRWQWWLLLGQAAHAKCERFLSFSFGLLAAFISPVKRRVLLLSGAASSAAEDILPSALFHNARWGVWKEPSEKYVVRLCIAGQDVLGCLSSREAAINFQVSQLASRVGWPRQKLDPAPPRSPVWDHPEALEPHKEYSFQAHDSAASSSKAAVSALSVDQLKQFDTSGFLIGLPVLDAEELCIARSDFDELLQTRTERATSEDAKFRSAHTLSRPLHQTLVWRLAKHPRVVAIVEDILGPHCVCWSAHLFCKLPGDPTEQPWHQDAGFWPLSQSRALTLWLAFDDVDESNASMTFIEGSHRLGRLPWQPTDAAHHLLTQQIPDVDLLGRAVHVKLAAGQASVHCDLTVHGSCGNSSSRRRAGLALRYVSSDAQCLGPMINGYRMNAGCILPKGPASDPQGHWKSIRRRAPKCSKGPGAG